MLKLASHVAAVSLLAAGAASAQSAAGDIPAPPAVAAGAAASAANTKLSTESTISDLLANEKAKAVLNKHVPQIVSSPQLGMVMAMKFSELQQFPEAALTPEIVKAIDADLAKL